MPKRKLAALEKVDADLANLQHKLRRDPLSYKDDFLNQYNQYEALRSILLQAPAARDSAGIVSLRDLIDFVSHVADCYPDATRSFPLELAEVITLHHAALESELRDKIVGSLVLLRNRDVIDSSTLLNILFPILISTPSKSLRELLFQKILADLRSSNVKTTNHKLNRTMQTVLQNLLSSDRTSSKGLWAVKITRELWKRQIWTDAKAVEIMKEASLSENEKIIMGGVRFFLGGDKEREEAAEQESEDEDAIDMAQLRHQAGINKKSKKKEKELKKAAATVKKKNRQKDQPHPLNFSALHLLHDPQGFAEQLFYRHLQNHRSKLNLEQKLLLLQLVSRLVGLHQLTVISLYSYFLKYLTPRQQSVTSFLACLAQSTHQFVPPDVLAPLIQKIADEFVSEAAASEVASAGLNAIREICVRQPLAMNDTLLQDLVLYRKSKDKGVMMAAKGLLGLYRVVGATMLKKRDRGKAAAMGLRSGDMIEKRFGEQDIGQIEGIELLEAWKEEERRRKRGELGLDPDGQDEGDAEREEEEGWEHWDVESDASDESGGWIDVPSDGEEIDISDDDNKPPAKKTRLSGITTDEVVEVAERASEKNTSSLATTRILTPADLSKLQELRLQADIRNSVPGVKAGRNTSSGRHIDDPLTAAEIEGLAALSKKRTKEEKIAMAKGERGEGNEKHLGKEARRQERKREQGKSSTNREKERQKNFLMTLGKARRKGKRSLGETRRVLRGHVERQKKGGRRGNRG